MKRQKFIALLLVALTGFTISFIVSFLFYLSRFKDDIFSHGLCTTDVWRILFSGALLMGTGILTYTLVFSALLFGANLGHAVKPIKLSLFILILTGFTFYIRAYTIPNICAYNYAYLFAAISEPDHHDKPIDVITNADLFSGGYATSTYTAMGIHIDSLLQEDKNYRKKRIDTIRKYASPVNLDKLLKNEKLTEAAFTKKEFTGPGVKFTANKNDNKPVPFSIWGPPSYSPQKRDSLRYFYIEAIAFAYLQERKMVYEMVKRYTDQRSEMIFFPFHLLLLIFAAFVGGLLLKNMHKAICFTLVALLLAPFATFTDRLFKYTPPHELPPVMRNNLVQLAVEIIILVVVWIVYKRVQKFQLKSETY